MFKSGPGEGFWGSGENARKLAPSSLTVESRPHEWVRKTESSTSESGFLLGASANRGSHWVSQPSQKSVPLSSSSSSPPFSSFDGEEGWGGGRA